MTKIVRKTRAEHKITPASRRRLAKLAARPEREIDFLDIPELDEAFFEKAVRNPFYPPVKKQVTVRLDADVIAWLRAQGSGYQTKINSMLRNAMLKALGKRTA
jgi:uncharacterized protein (DUF4415 family)